LLLYLLGRLHREKQLNAQMFADAKGMQAKVRVYDEAVKWVLERQREDLNDQISGLETEDLRQVLREAALCVMQSGNETAQLAMLKGRFTDSANPVAELLKQAQKETEKTEDKALNNLLAAFYLKPGDGDRTGSVEFAHKSFGEFLFAERLRYAFDGWVEVDKRERFRMKDREIAKQIYDLLGFGALTSEIFEYLKELLFDGVELDKIVRLFQRLHIFYENWSEGVYIDQGPGENLPQNKMKQLEAEELETGLRQVDKYAGLNVMILLFELHRYGQQSKSEQNCSRIHFHPCGNIDAEAADNRKLLRIISYSQIISMTEFVKTVGCHLHDTDLIGVDLSGVDLSGANFRRAELFESNFSNAKLVTSDFSEARISWSNLSNADFCGANLERTCLQRSSLSRASFVRANLSRASLESADLSESNLSHANLTEANLSGDTGNFFPRQSTDLSRVRLSNTNLSDIQFNEEMEWRDVTGLDTAKNVPDALKQQLGLT